MGLKRTPRKKFRGVNPDLKSEHYSIPYVMGWGVPREGRTEGMEGHKLFFQSWGGLCAKA